MKKLLTVTAISVAVMLVVLPMTYGQDKAAPGQEKGAPGAPPAQAERVFEGQLVKVDADAKSITVKGAAEMTFDYTDATQIAGGGNIQGLASKTGAPLKVTYREAQGKRIATRIEVQEKK